MTYRSHIVGPSRVFDHIYDPLFVASDRKDVCRANNVALSRSAPIGIFPVYQTMFSELPRMTRNHYVMHRNPLPYYPDVQVNSNGTKPVQVPDLSRILGTERSKFFCHPTAGESGALLKMGESVEEFCHCDQSAEPRTKDAASQTVYRESSAQTQPWMPTAVLKDADFGTAEIVYVAEMLQHTRYPGINEVEIIERARKKRNWEYALGSCDSAEEWAQQKLTLQIFEWEEWVARERQIDRYQMLRLQLVAKIMGKRERDTRQATECKMENSKNRINEERNKAMEKLRINYERSMRKLEKKRNDSKANKFRSPHVPRSDDTTLAVSKKTGTKKSYNYDPNLIEVGLTKLERKITVSHKLKDIHNQRPELWKPKEVCRESQKGFWSDNFLRKLYDSLKHFRHKKDSKPAMPKCLIVVSSPTESIIASPPRVSEEREDDNLYQQAILLQKLIRGRATQEMIHKDYAADRDLVEDLIATHRLPVVEEFFPIAPIKTGSVREKYLHILRNEQLLDEFIENSTHAQMTSLMSTLERELSRLQNERNTQAFYLLTEQERYFREARETRHISEMKFQDNEEIAIYLENALLEKVEGECLDETRNKIHTLVKQFDSEADKRISSGEEPAAQGGQDVIASCLMDEMMMPDIFRRLARENIKLKQKPLLAEAHELIFQQQVEMKPLDSVPEEVMEILMKQSDTEVLGDQLGDEVVQEEDAPDLETRSEGQVIIGDILSNVIESVMSENEVEEIPEDDGTDGFGMSGSISVEEDGGQMATEIIEDILSHVFETNEK